MDEVDPAVYEREATYMAGIQDILDAGSLAEALAWIREQDGVVEAEADDRQLAFRLEGGRPLFIIDPSVEVGSGLLGMEEPFKLAAEPLASTTPPPVADVVGRGTQRDNPQNRKKALFLEPYQWEMGQHFDEGIAELRLIDDYAHAPDDVKPLRDEQVTPAVYASWAAYDAVFVMTHGGNIGKWRWIASGQYEPVARRGPNRGELCKQYFESFYQPTPTGIDCNYLTIGGPLEAGGQLSLVLGASTEFFNEVYKQGLHKAIVYIGGCGVMRNDDMAAAVAGTTSAFLGWNNFVAVGAGTGQRISERSANGLLRALVDLRQTVRGAYDAMVTADLVYDPGNTSTLVVHDNGDEPKKLRLYDLPTLRDPTAPTNILKSGAKLRITGSPGDGENDRLELAVQVIGVIDPDASVQLPPPPSPPPDAPIGAVSDFVLASFHESPANLYDVRLHVGDEQVGSDNLGDPRPGAEVEALDETTYLYRQTVPLPFDVDPAGTRTTLKVEVVLPEGGVSDYELDVTLVGSSYALIAVGNTTWEFIPSDFWQCFIGETATGEVAIVAGDINADGDEFGAELHPGGGNLSVRDEQAGEKWEALADRDVVTVLHLLPVGRSQIDTITIEDGRAWGQATFIEVNAANAAWQESPDAPDWPPSVPGTFEVQCSG